MLLGRTGPRMSNWWLSDGDKKVQMGKVVWDVKSSNACCTLGTPLSQFSMDQNRMEAHAVSEHG